MAVKLSKGVTQRMRSCLFVLSAFRQQGPGIAARMLDLVLPNLRQGDARPDFLAHLVAFGRTLEAALDRLLAADHGLYDLRQEQRQARARRDRQVRDLERKIVGLRRSVLGCYDAPELDRLGLGGPNARNPVGLWRQAELIAEELRRDDLDEVLGEPLLEPAFDPRPYAEQLESPLMATLEELAALQRRVDLALEDKRRAMAAYDHVFLRAARHFEEMCRFVGEEGLAAKVRPCTTRPGRTVEQPVVEAGPAEDAGERAASGEGRAVEEDPSAEPAAGAGGAGVSVAGPAGSRPVLRLVPRGPTAENGSRAERGQVDEDPVRLQTPLTPPARPPS